MALTESSTSPDDTPTEVSQAAEATAAAEGGQRIGPADDPDRYELAQVRSRGGEGELWRGAIRVDGQALDVAVKIIHAANVADIDEWSERWRRQAEILRSLEHPGLVKVREVFEGPLPHAPGAADPSTRSLYLVMNWVSGTSLPEWVTLNPERDILESTRVVNRLAAAVDYLHSGKATGTPVLHRDIKPANVIVDGGDVRLVDFGFAHLAAAPDMTMAGTPAYLAPEVVGGAPPTEASDNYSLGATAYFALVGENPTPNDVNAMRTRLMAVGGVEGRQDFADHVLAMMSRDPARRPSRAVEWAQSLAVGAISETLISDRRLAAASDVDPEPESAGRPKKRRGLLVAAIIVVILALGGGAAAVVATSSSSSSDGGKASPSTTRKAATAAAAASATMPDVVGETLEDAKATLRKRKLTDITVQEQESSEPVGTVIEQDPVAGAKSSGSATLTVAKAVGTMPDVTGKTLSVATNTLKALGANVTANDTLDDTKPDGTVVSQDPAAGSPFSPNVTLQIARQPVVTYLSDLSPVEGGADSGVATMGGTTYAHAVTFYASSASTKAGYDLGRHYRRLRGTVGLRDDDQASSSVKVEVFADGRSIFSQTVGLGQSVELDLDVTNVLRLELVGTNLARTSQLPSVVWGDVRLLGAPSEVPGSTANSSSSSATVTTTTSTSRP
ncbi:MAG TPA: PASTA domain-containing protein [Acidimicrobiia bacterium]